MIASVWDGIANFVTGILVDRRRRRIRYGPLIAAGAMPLGLTFVLTYMPPPARGGWAVCWVLVAHLLFRTAYAGVNVPYLAMSARISSDPADRAFVAGTRMLFGTAAAVAVALGTVRLGCWLTGSSAAQAYFGAAIFFAITGAAILILVGATYRDGMEPQRPLPGSLQAALLSLARNRAFVALNAQYLTTRLGCWNLGPRAHPGDGLLDTYDARLPVAQLLAVRARLHHGAHLPHPAITVRRAHRVEVRAARPVPLEVDGAPAGRITSLALTLRPAAYRLLV